jgi:SAM-dependent methyltransferase
MLRISRPLARFRRKAWNVLLDLRYGAMLRGSVATMYPEKGSTETANTAYDVLAEIFPPGSIREDDVLVDIGCGKGRVLNWWLSRGYRNKIIGIELDPRIAEQTRRRLRRYRNVVVITGDAIENLPPDGTVYYLYNPFKLPVVRAFCDRLAKSLDGSKEVRIYYFHPSAASLAVFEKDPRWQIAERRTADKLWSKGDVAVIRPACSQTSGGVPSHPDA